MIKNKTICIAGKNEVCVNAINYLLDELSMSLDSLLIIPNTTDNGIDNWQPSVRNHAIKRGLQIVSLSDIQSIENLVFISLEYDKLLKPHLFKSKQLFNIHYSLLPKYKGMYTSCIPLLNGELQSGVTLHMIDDGIDTGDIISQRNFVIDINDTSRDLYFKYMQNGLELFCETIRYLHEGNFKTRPQEGIGSSYYSKNSVDFNNIFINFHKTSFEIHNQLRAFIFKEYQLPYINGSQIERSVLSTEQISRNTHIEKEDYFII